MQFGILGPLLVRDGDAVKAVPAARQRVLLAALVVRAGQAVAVDELAEVVWDGSPPAGAAATLRTHVMRLRRVVGARVGARLLTRYPGYLLDAGECDVDVLRFHRLCREGGAAVRAGGWETASRVLGEALGLWRGAPLADVPSAMLCRHESPGLERLRLQALEWRVDAGLALGAHAEFLAELRPLVVAHPLRERFHAQLMVALYRCGQQAEALAAYEHARQVLDEELGVEPGAELRDLRARVLASDEELLAAQAAGVTEAGAPVTVASQAAPVPRELPAPVGFFVGRAAELAALAARQAEAAAQPGTVVISVIGGTAGVGKTALAVQWAHHIAAEFPDGQLYVNLRGYDPRQPMPAGDALAAFLGSLGVDRRDIPAELDERAARYRSLLSGRRVLIVLDNASDVEQVRPLLPGSEGCMVIVTSRDALPGLIARDGARRVDLDLLPGLEAVELLRVLIGPRVDEDPGAAAALAAQCGRLPLALRVAAELAAARPDAPLSELAAELAAPVTPVPPLTDPADARAWMDGLRATVTAMSAQTITHGSPRHATQGVITTWRYLERGGYLSALTTQSHCAYGAAQHTGDLGAQAELLNIIGVVDLAQGRHQDAARYLGEALAANRTAGDQTGEARALCGLGQLDTQQGRYASAASRLGQALALFRATGDRFGEAGTLVSLGVMHQREGHCDQAACHFDQALALSREIADVDGEADALASLGLVRLRQGSYADATSHLERSLAIFRARADPGGEAHALAGLGSVELLRGHHERATSHGEQAVALFRQIGCPAGEARALNGLAEVLLATGQPTAARARFASALALATEAGEAYEVARSQDGLARAAGTPCQPSLSLDHEATA